MFLEIFLKEKVRNSKEFIFLKFAVTIWTLGLEFIVISYYSYDFFSKTIIKFCGFSTKFQKKCYRYAPPPWCLEKRSEGGHICSDIH